MADKYAVAAGGNWSAAGTWSLVDGGAGGAGAPSAAENAFFSNLSGNVVVDAPATCLDFDQTKGTGYAGTLSGSSTLAVSGSMKRRGTWAYSGAITMAATSTGKTIQNNGVAYAGNSLTFSGSGGGWTFADASTGLGNLLHSAGTADYAGFSVGAGAFTMNQAAASVTLGAATLTLAGFWLVSSGTLSAALSSITLVGNFNFDGGSNAYGSVTMTSGQAANTITGSNSFVNLTLLNGANKSQGFTVSGANNTISGLLTITSNSVINRILFASNVTGTQRTITVTGPTPPALSNVDFQDINAAGGSPIAPWVAAGVTTLGDCGGNSGITFTPAATQTATGTASFTWSTHGWTSRVPLPQDDVVVNNAFIAGRTVTIDMPRVGKSIDFSASTGSPTVTVSVAISYFGSWKQSANMTRAGSSAMTAQGRGSFVFQSNGVPGASSININAPGGTLTLSDALTVTGNNIVAQMGTFADGGFSVACFNAQATLGTITKTGNWTLSGLSWSVSTTATMNDTAGFIKFVDATASTKVFGGGGKAYNDVWFSGAGTGVYQITQSNTFGTFRADTGRNLQFTAGTTSTATTWTIDGCTIGSITASNHTLAKAGGGKVKAQGVTVSRSTASPTFTFYDFGTGAVDGGNNVNWQFYNPDYSLVINPLSYALTYQPASILAQRRLVCASLIYSYTMTNATILAQRRMALNPLVYSITFQQASILAARRLTLASLVYGYTVKDLSSLLATRRMALAPLTYSYTLGDVQLRDFPRDPLYIVSGGARNRTAYAGGRRTVNK